MSGEEESVLRAESLDALPQPLTRMCLYKLSQYTKIINHVNMLTHLESVLPGEALVAMTAREWLHR